MTDLVLEYREIQSLKNHPRNAATFGELSGDADCDEFVTSIRDAGRIRTPLTIAPDGVVVSGHRRRQGAARAGLKVVPCIVDHSLTTPESIDQAWADANLNRVMTEVQRTRFYMARKEIEAVSARARMVAGNPGGKFPQGQVTGRDPGSKLTQGKAGDIAAESVGWSRKTAEKAARVVQAIDAANADGKPVVAAQLTEVLESRGATAAAKTLDLIKQPVGKWPGPGEREIKALLELTEDHSITSAPRDLDGSKSEASATEANSILIPPPGEVYEFIHKKDDGGVEFLIIAPSAEHPGYYWLAYLDQDDVVFQWRPMAGWAIGFAISRWQTIGPGTCRLTIESPPWEWQRFMFASKEEQSAEMVKSWESHRVSQGWPEKFCKYDPAKDAGRVG